MRIRLLRAATEAEVPPVSPTPPLIINPWVAFALLGCIIALVGPKKLLRRLRRIVPAPYIASLCFLVFFTALFSLLEGWGLLNACYFSAQVLTSAGFGDLAPKTALGKAASCLAVVVGPGLVWALVGARYMAVRSGSRGDGISELRRQFVQWLAFVLTGAAFYWYREGAARDGLLEGVHFSLATVTTVGYGDNTPRTPEGRAFAIVFMLAGALKNAEFMAAALAAFEAARASDESGGHLIPVAERDSPKLSLSSPRQQSFSSPKPQAHYATAAAWEPESAAVLVNGKPCTCSEYVLYSLQARGKVTDTELHHLRHEFNILQANAGF